MPDIQIKHNVAAQKEHGYTRYEVDKGTRALFLNNTNDTHTLPTQPIKQPVNTHGYTRYEVDKGTRVH